MLLIMLHAGGRRCGRDNSKARKCSWRNLPAGVPWPPRTADELSAGGAEALLKVPADLLTLLDGR